MPVSKMPVSKEVKFCLDLWPSLLSRESVCEPADAERLLKGVDLSTGMRAMRSFLNRFPKRVTILSTIWLGVHGGRVHAVTLE
jgi:hypothetical protein